MTESSGLAGNGADEAVWNSGLAGVDPNEVYGARPSASRSAPAKSAHDANRFSGTFASPRASTKSVAAGRSGRRATSEGGG